MTEFRISQFKTAKEFEVNNFQEFSKQQGQNLIIENDKKIISAMQFEMIQNKSTLNEKAELNVPPNFASFNTFYLSKGATNREYRNAGLNSILRLLIINGAIKNNSIKSLTGVAYDNSPRINLLQKIGYHLTEVDDLPHSNFTNKVKIYFIELPQTNFASAISLLEEETKELFRDFIITIDSKL